MNTPTLQRIQRLARPVAYGVILASVLAPPIGCGERLRRNKSTAQSTEPPQVNAGLTKIGDSDQPVISIEQPEDGFDETRQKVLESASMLESYFSNAESELDTPSEPIVRADARESDPAQQPGTPAQQTSGSDTGAETGPGVRVSLADAAAESVGEPVVDADVAAAQMPDNSDEKPIQIVSAGGEDGGFMLPENPEMRKERLVDELVGVLNELAQSADDPGAAAVALAGLETMRPDTLAGLREQGLISDSELASLDAVRSMLRSIVGDPDGGGTIASPSEVSEMLARIQRNLNATAGLAINDAKLCVSVSGYGQYEQFASNTFVAGRTHRAIVYVEMDRFTQREMTGPDGQARFEVKLSQRLELYHIADDLNTWNRKAETDTTISRNRLRDYYLINQITLPPNLGVGRYNLKVVMRDLIANQVVEAIIPIEIVAG